MRDLLIHVYFYQLCWKSCSSHLQDVDGTSSSSACLPPTLHLKKNIDKENIDDCFSIFLYCDIFSIAPLFMMFRYFKTAPISSFAKKNLDHFLIKWQTRDVIAAFSSLRPQSTKLLFSHIKETEPSSTCSVVNLIMLLLSVAVSRLLSKQLPQGCGRR